MMTQTTLLDINNDLSLSINIDIHNIQNAGFCYCKLVINKVLSIKKVCPNKEGICL
jgi:hypothetical protein